MPSSILEDFKGNLNDICRPNRFTVSIRSDNSNIDFGDEDYFFVKGCSIPGKTMGEIELNWMGHKYKVAGDPTFNDVTITFLNDLPATTDEFSVRNKFETWFSLISEDPSNIRTIHSDYKATVFINQLNGKNEVVNTYKLINAHPKELGDIELSMESTDAVEEFTVVFSYSYVEYGDDDGQSSGSSEVAE